VTGADRLAVGALFAAALVTGTAGDVPRPSPARALGGYQVLAADFHVHMFPLGWATLAPWDTVIEARHQGLDVIAMVPHNLVWLGKVGRWFSPILGGPMVIAGEEITAPDYHLLAVGIDEPVSAQLPIGRAIAEVHRQRGIAIAAHPYENSWPAFETALSDLDGAEVVRPEAQNSPRMAAQLREFYARARSRGGSITAVGDSDYHGAGPMGYSRTYVFARERTEQGVLDAIREGRTVVYDRDQVYGDPAMIQIAEAAGGLRHEIPAWPTPGAARAFSRFATLLVLVGVLLLNRWD
jgi:hypothetical protein